MGQDTLLHAFEGRPGLDAQIVRQSRPGLAVGVQRVSLPAGTVQRQHELLPEGLAVGLLEREAAQLLDELPVEAERQLRVDPVLEHGQSQLVEARGFAARERLVGELHERRTAPQGECLSEVLHPPRQGRRRRVPCAHQPRGPRSAKHRVRPVRPAGGSQRCRSRDAHARRRARYAVGRCGRGAGDGRRRGPRQARAPR